MELSLSLLWRIVLLQLIVSMALYPCLRNTALMSDAALIPWKPTIGFLIMALALVTTQVIARFSLVRAIFGASLGLADAFWRLFSFALALYCLVLALGNLALARAVTFDMWVMYKTSIPIVALLLFVAIVPSRLLVMLPKPNIGAAGKEGAEQ